MSENIINFPTAEVTEDVPESTVTHCERASIQGVAAAMKEAKKMVDFFQSTWDNAKNEFGITDDQMAKLIEYNNSARTPRSNEDQADEDYDDLNGLVLIPMERVADIFGRDSHIFGVEPTQTIDRLRYAASIFTELFKAHKEFRQIDKQFAELMDLSERESIDALRKTAAEESDPDKRAQAQESIDRYEGNKYLRFLTEMDESKQAYLVESFSNHAKIRYLLERGRVQMKKLSIPETYILEISGFEKRFLPAQYISHSNLLLLTFLQMMAFGKPAENHDVYLKASAMIIGLDKVIRHTWAPDDLEKIMANIIAFEDLFVGKLPELEIVQAETKNLQPGD